MLRSSRCSRGSASVIATPFPPRATRASDAMHVGLGRGGHVVVHDVRDVLDVEAARGDVGRDEELGVAGAEALHHAIALLLREPTVQRLGAIAAAVEGLGQLVHFECASGRTRSPTSATPRRARDRARPSCGRARRCTPSDARAALARGGRLAIDRDAHRVLEVLLGDRRRSAAAASPRRAPSVVRPASRRGSPRDPRRIPCRASRRPRRGRRSAPPRARSVLRRM